MIMCEMVFSGGGGVRSTPGRRAFKRRFMEALIATACSAVAYATIPRMRSRSLVGYNHIQVDTYEPLKFKELFRFRKHEVWELMAAFGFLDVNGHPYDIRVGNDFDVRRRSWISTESAFLIVLRRLAFPARLDDLTDQLGCSLALVLKAFIHMRAMLYTEFVQPIYEIERWVGFFAEFANRFKASGSPFDDIVAWGRGVCACELQRLSGL